MARGGWRGPQNNSRFGPPKGKVRLCRHAWGKLQQKSFFFTKKEDSYSSRQKHKQWTNTFTSAARHQWKLFPIHTFDSGELCSFHLQSEHTCNYPVTEVPSVNEKYRQSFPLCSQVSLKPLNCSQRMGPLNHFRTFTLILF